ncbi:MAG: ATP-dependent RecD-like DNA helicase [Cytophagaceae bacterium]
MSPSEQIINGFPFEPTYGQIEACRLFNVFLADKDSERPSYILKGYAGTGKTTLISQIVKLDIGYDYVLLAPTGRAAKVMSSYSGRGASTIHREIFIREKDDSGMYSFKRKKNTKSKTIYIIDEASMISDDVEYGGRSLLADLLEYIYSKPKNKLLFVGDPAQLPPVGKTNSPALDASYMAVYHRLNVLECELTEVVRQEVNSGVLLNATRLRNSLANKDVNFRFVTQGYRDVYRITPDKLEDGIRYALNKFGQEETIVICRSNKAAVNYNNYIRRSIQFREEEIDAGEILMVVKNNYTVIPEDHKAEFIANGDFVEVLKIRKLQELYGFRFGLLEMQLLDYPEQPAFEAWVILDVLHSNAPGLTQEEYKKLYESVLEDYTDLPKYKRGAALKNDKFLNALQVKYAYALTCHKSQGGQWGAVFLDQGFLQEDMINTEYVRWLYTAVTRAGKELYLLNFDDRFF